MKKLILSLLFIHLINYCNGQNSITFKIQYKPKTIYNQKIEQILTSELEYVGSEHFLEKIKEKGIQNPTISNTKLNIETNFKTGKLIDNSYFPLTIEYIKSLNGNGTSIIPNGTIIYGKGYISQMPILDSISSKGVNDEFKKSMLQTMQSTISQLNIPEKTIKIGENFSYDTPLTIPAAGVTIDMQITTTYKLLSIKHGIGDFDIIQVYTMTSTNKDFNIIVTGKGNGKLFYNISHNYTPKYTVDTEMVVKMEKNGFAINSKSKATYTLEVEIKKN